MCASNMSVKKYTQQLSEEKCKTPCFGNKHEACGGKDAIEWHRIKGACFEGKSNKMCKIFQKFNKKRVTFQLNIT